MAILLLATFLMLWGPLGCHDWSGGGTDSTNEGTPSPLDDDDTGGQVDDDTDGNPPDDDDNDDTGGSCDGCLIGSACYADGQASFNNPCLFCDVEQATGAWSDNDGAACDDGLFCNGEDTCLAGTCSSHVGDPCAEGDVCNNTCNEETDDCFSPATAACEDDLFCNGEDHCDGAGACAHAGDPCAGGNACNNTCNEETDDCFSPEETTCDDGLFCNGEDACDGAGTCGHTGDPCAGGNVCNQCNEAAGNCFSPDTTPCDDGVFCNGEDHCDGAGSCVHPGDPCLEGDACNNRCNEDTNNCYSLNMTSCDDGKYCNGDDYCDGFGTCEHSGDPCAGGDDCHQCNELQDNCLSIILTPCEDHVFCNGNDRCDGEGNCSLHTGDPCASGAQCNNHCNESTTDCHAPGGTICADGNFCNGTDQCDGEGHCSVHSGDPCAGGDECHQCNILQGNCISIVLTPCDDGLFCNGADRCDNAGNCVNHAGDPCAEGDECNDACNEETDDCFSPAPTACDDGIFCNGEDTCDGAGVCAHAGDPCGGDPCSEYYDFCGVCEFQVNTYTNDDQDYSAVISDDSGNFVIAWESIGQDGSGPGVYAKMYNADGSVYLPEFLVNTNTDLEQRVPYLGMDATGNYIVTWSSVEGLSANEVMAQRFTAAGAFNGDEFMVNQTTSQWQAYGAVAVNDAGAFVVAWESYGQDGSEYGIYGQCYDASGAVTRSEFRINTFTANNQTHPEIGMDGAGNFVVVWNSYGQDAEGGYGVFGQLFDAACNARDEEFQINQIVAGDQQEVDVARIDSTFVVIYESAGADGDGFGIFARQYDADGIALDDEQLVNSTYAGNQINPAIAMNETGYLVAVWEDEAGHDGELTGIYGQVFAGLDTPLGEEFPINTYFAGNQLEPDIAIDQAANFIVTWSSAGQDSSDFGVFASQFDLNGIPYCLDSSTAFDDNDDTDCRFF